MRGISLHIYRYSCPDFICESRRSIGCRRMHEISLWATLPERKVWTCVGLGAGCCQTAGIIYRTWPHKAWSSGAACLSSNQVPAAPQTSAPRLLIPFNFPSLRFFSSHPSSEAPHANVVSRADILHQLLTVAPFTNCHSFSIQFSTALQVPIGRASVSYILCSVFVSVATLDSILRKVQQDISVVKAPKSQAEGRFQVILVEEERDS